MKTRIYVFFYILFPVFLFTAVVFSAMPLTAQTDNNAKMFRFKYRNGDAYRIISSVNEDILVNGQMDHHSLIINRISVQVTGTGSDGSGTVNAIFMTTENGTNTVSGTLFSWGTEYKSVFTRSIRGTYAISDDYFMPVVRDVPVFPEYAVKPGDTWTAQGYEAHDLRQTFGIKKPFKVPFSASYTYVGPEKENNGQLFDIIDVRYNLYFESPASTAGSSSIIDNLPAITMGYSHQTLYWNNDKGELDHYNEEFRIAIDTHYGDEFVFKGTAEAKVAEFNETNTDQNVQDVQDTVNKLGLKNVSVKKGDKGLTISIDDIQFPPDSSELQENEKQKLLKLVKILKKYPNDLLITGYCALRGSAADRLRLSEERAQAVANNLLSLQVRNADCIFTQGKGAENPVASNDTEEGRILNRRVEITILDD